MVTILVGFVLCLVGIICAWSLFGLIKRLLYRPDMKNLIHFYDKESRIVIYRGFNVCNYSKTSDTYLPWHTRADYERLKGWGVNVVRFLVYWEAIEPVRYTYNTAYIEKVIEHIKILGDLGIQVIIDMHQDVYARKFTGNGFPPWAICDEGKPFKPQNPWALNYLQPAVLASFKNFWNDDGLKYKYSRTFCYFANYIKDLDNVIGVDLMNEPFPKLPWIAHFEKRTLSDFYKNICRELKITLKFSKTIFFEPWMSTSSGFPTYLDKSVASKGIQYLPHFYPPFCCETGKYRWIDKFLMKWAFKIKAREAQLFGSPLFFGECGASPFVTGYPDLVRDFHDLANEYQVSWAWWVYDKDIYDIYAILDEKGAEKEILDLIVQVYPQKIAGTNPKFYNKGCVFFLTYDNTGIKEPTVIFAPEKYEYRVYTECPHNRDGSSLLFYNTGAKSTEIKIEYWKK